MSKSDILEFQAIKDLLSQFHFEADKGKIWFNEQQMLLIHAGVMGLLRKDLIDSLGVQRAKRLLIRFGYHSGWKDAELVRKIRPNVSEQEAFSLGPQLHSIKGMVTVEPVVLEFDVKKKAFYGDINWHDSYEVDEHLQHFGPSKEPVCWTLLGYASGFSTYYMGETIIFKEVACGACGDDHCRIIGKPLSQWEEKVELEKLLLPDPIAEELFSLQAQLSELRETFQEADGNEDVLFNSVGKSGAFRNACQLIKKAGPSKITVLLQGETGVGKEVFARGLHMSSDRAEKPFVAVNCACIPQELIEAELFGVERGAFTGATETRIGKFERANSGTIFLDEVVELSAKAQASLLRVLQEGEFEKVGAKSLQKVDVRVIAATNENLEDAVATGKFRADLFYRLSVYPVFIPPLRERVEDIPLLIDHFLEKYHGVYNKRTLGVSDMAMNSLTKYAWPGNIRELENMIERGVILADNNHTIDHISLFPSLSEPSHPLNVIGSQGRLMRDTPEPKIVDKKAQPSGDVTDVLLDSEFDLEGFEATLLRRALTRCDGNVSAAARMLGITRPQLAYRMKKLPVAKLRH